MVDPRGPVASSLLQGRRANRPAKEGPAGFVVPYQARQVRPSVLLESSRVTHDALANMGG